jgi:hypothetical protein
VSSIVSEDLSLAPAMVHAAPAPIQAPEDGLVAAHETLFHLALLAEGLERYSVRAVTSIDPIPWPWLGAGTAFPEIAWMV